AANSAAGNPGSTRPVTESAMSVLHRQSDVATPSQFLVQSVSLRLDLRNVLPSISTYDMSWGSSLTPFYYRHFTDLLLDWTVRHEELHLLFADVLVIVVEAQVLVIVVEERGADRGRHVVLPVLVQHHRAA